MTSSSEPVKRAPRQRTPRQLQRKRALDKESQKLKRLRHKDHIRDLEDQLSAARDEIRRLRSQLPLSSTLEHPPLCDEVSLHRGWAKTHPARLNPKIQCAAPTSASTDVASPSRRQSASSSSSNLERTSIRCYCKPMVHASFSDCFEMTVYETMMACRKGSDWVGPGPTTPELADLLCIRIPENPMSMILHKLTRRANMDGLVIHCAVFILSYRILRYRLFPSIETYNDVPDWIRSTDVHDNIPHPLYMDFVQFPRLRDALILGQADLDEIREDIDDDFKRFLSVNWPPSKSLLVTDRSRNTILHPEFVAHVCTEENWSLDPGFATKYPHLATFVRIKGQQSANP